MTIRKGKLHRPCRKCNEMFKPSGPATYLCNKCKPNQKRIYAMLKLQKKIQKKNG